MKRALLRASKSFKIQQEWTPVKVRSVDISRQAVEIMMPSMKDLTATTLLDPHERNDFCRVIESLSSNDLFLVSRDLLRLQENGVSATRVGTVPFQVGSSPLSQLWSAIARRVIKQCQLRPRTKDFHKSLYPVLPPQMHFKAQPGPEIDSKKAVYFLFFISRAAHVLDKEILAESFGLLLCSVTPSFQLTGEEVLSLLKSINILATTIANDQQTTITTTEEQIAEINTETWDSVHEEDYGDHETHRLHQGSHDERRYHDSSLGHSSTLIPTNHLIVNDGPQATVSLKTLIEGVVRSCVGMAASRLSIEQAIQIGRELAMLDIFVPNLFKRVRSTITSDEIRSLDIDFLLVVVDTWTRLNIRDRDMEIFHRVAAEIMNYRIDGSMTPRQIAQFLHLYGTAKVSFPFVFARCVVRLLRLSSAEQSQLDWIVNRSYGQVLGSDGRWHTVPLPDTGNDDPLDFQIGAWDSKIFVGSKYTLTCRDDAESNEWEFYSRLLTEQLTMDPQTTLDKYPQAELDSITYPLFGMVHFESAMKKVNDDVQPTLRHPIEGPTSFAKLITQMLKGLNAVSYHDEFLLRPLGQLLAESQLRPSRHRSHKASNNHDGTSMRQVRRAGLQLLYEWDVSDLLTVASALMGGGTRMPSRTITAITERLLPHLAMLGGWEFGQLMENIAKSSRGIHPDFFADPKPIGKSTCWSPSTKTLWEMSPHGMACWIMNLSRFAPPAIFHDSSTEPLKVEGWVATEAFQTAIEALAQKLLIAYRFNRNSLQQLPLVTDTVVSGFTWAAEEFREEWETSDEAPPQQKALPNSSDSKLRLTDSMSWHLHQEMEYPNGSSEEIKDELIIDSNELTTHERRSLELFIAELKSLKNEDRLKSSKATGDLDFNHRPDSNTMVDYDLQMQSHPGHSSRSLSIEGTHHEVHYSYETAMKSFRVVWTALLSYALISDVWRVSSSLRDDHRRRDDRREECPLPIEVLPWEEALRVKLRALPLRTVAMLYDLFVICEEAVSPTFTNESSEEASQEFSVQSRHKILKHIQKHGYEGLEPWHINHPDIVDFLKVNIENNGLPPLPPPLERIYKRHVPSTHPSLSSSVEAPHQDETDDDKSNATTSVHQRTVYRGLNLIMRRLHQFLGCRRSTGTEEISQLPTGFTEAVSIKPNVPIGPLVTSLYVSKVKQRTK